MRSDHWAMRRVYEVVGEKALREVAEAPYFDLQVNELCTAKTDGREIVGAFPFTAFVVMLNIEIKGYRQKQWFYVHPASAINSPKNVRIDHCVLACCDRFVGDNIGPAMVSFGLGYKGGHLAIFITDDAEILLRRQGLHPNGRLEACGDVIVGGIYESIRQISFGDRHWVEEKAAPISGESHTKKPWTRGDLPRIILIDPNSPLFPRHDLGGHHASPSPHRRRGHFRELRSPRFVRKCGQKVWTRPAWVGPETWEANGKSYRVLTKISS